ncbi:penicillin-binding transpeptidase domain-containing protein [Streptosporangium sp. NPDC000396]|uniref:penicillin-binding transpeptidase domain-containing protein n=1 Tax=Streptosporangium sp. NPDC000396 TaxID=3366185 RepID=UPI003677F541
MRSRWLLALIALVVAIVAVSTYGLVTALNAVVAAPEPGFSEGTTEKPPFTPTPTSPLTPAPPISPAPVSPASSLTPPPAATPTSAPASPGGPELTAASYFAAWQAGDIPSMLGLVADPPADFAARHRRFDTELRVSSLSLTPGELRRQGGEAAEVSFRGVREVRGLGRWEFSSVLGLALRSGAWKVLWTPETLHPSLRNGGSLRLRETQVRRPAALTREGLPFPRDSRADDYRDYLTGLGGTAINLTLEEVPSGRALLTSPNPPPTGKRSTISRSVQAAAARALDGVGRPAAIVAVDIQSRQVRAVADTLGARGAFNGLYPPGSTFKVVTAAALLRTGLTPDSPVACPMTYNPPGARSFSNADGIDHGTVSLTTAFALSCNTTFVQQTYERLRDDRLRAEAADRFGFREKPGLSSCRIRPSENPDQLGADAIGQNSVQASPLCMAEVAAAAASGVWKPAIMTADPSPDLPPPVPLDEGVAAGLRAMMGAVVTQGTAAQAGLPPGTAGKTGTAEVKDAEDHAWFIGYRGPLAFAVFVQNGGSGGRVAAPIAARFLKAL